LAGSAGFCARFSPPPVVGDRLTRPKAGCAMLGRNERLLRLGKSTAVLEPVAIAQ
jgi:hypothetical protein